MGAYQSSRTSKENIEETRKGFLHGLSAHCYLFTLLDSLRCHVHVWHSGACRGHSCLHDCLPASPCQELPHLEPPHAHSQKQNVLSGWQISHREAHDQPRLGTAVAPNTE